MTITVLVIGSLKESYWREAEKEYLKRLSPYSKIEVLEFPDYSLKDKASLKDIEDLKNKEAEKVLKHLQPSDFVVTLDLNKEEPDSVSLSKKIENYFERGNSHINFVIGGSYGLSDDLKKRANASLSLSKLTFTHQMTRIILLEQIYRSFKILHNEKYHK